MPSAVIQHFWSTSAQGLHIRNTNVYIQVWEEGQLMIWEIYYFFFPFCFLFPFSLPPYNCSEVRTFFFATKLRHQRTTCCAAPMLQLDPLWIKLSGMFSLPVCIRMKGPFADTYKLMQYAKMKAVLSQKDLVYGVGRAVSQCCLCLVWSILWLGTPQRFCFPTFKLKFLTSEPLL